MLPDMPSAKVWLACSRDLRGSASCLTLLLAPDPPSDPMSIDAASPSATAMDGARYEAGESVKRGLSWCSEGVGSGMLMWRDLCRCGRASLCC